MVQVWCRRRASLVAQVVKNLSAKSGDTGSIPESGRSPREGNGNPLVFLLGGFHGQSSLVGCSPWGCKVSDTTEHLTHEQEAVTSLRDRREVLVWVPEGTRGRLAEHRALGSSRGWGSQEGDDTEGVVQGWVSVTLPGRCPGAWTLYHVRALGSQGRLFLGKGNNMIRFTF